MEHIEKVSDLSTDPVEALPETPMCPSCESLRRLLSKLRSQMALMETEIISLSRKMEEMSNVGG